MVSCSTCHEYCVLQYRTVLHYSLWYCHCTGTFLISAPQQQHSSHGSPLGGTSRIRLRVLQTVSHTILPSNTALVRACSYNPSTTTLHTIRKYPYSRWIRIQIHNLERSHMSHIKMYNLSYTRIATSKAVNTSSRLHPSSLPCSKYWQY